ncbi:MAG: deoxynucleoside kinase [Bacilli bacterium]|nr:deoxynucleoside kinase [Bacilli bacterium]
MGKLIVIEGSCDSVGKSTQYKLLIDRLMKETNNNIITHHFPSYGTYQGRPVEEYLKGNYGKISELSPYFVNSLYAQDRAITWISGLKQEYDKGSIIVLDRYTTSSLIYQSSVIEDEDERNTFIDYVHDYEYNKLGLPIPDLVIFLYADFEVAKALKEKRKNTTRCAEDIHEKDLEYLRKVSDTSVAIANKYNWHFIECTDGMMRSIEDIHEDIYDAVKKKILSK